MPRRKQIIPTYSFPHEETFVNDWSAQDTTIEEAITTRLNYLAVFAGPKGPDGKLTYIEQLDNYRKMYGRTNYAKYGQPHLMPEAYLSTPGTGVWCLRVAADDAGYANSIMSVWFKKDEANKAFRIKFTSKSLSVDDITAAMPDTINPLKSREILIELASKLDGTAVDGVYVDDEGYTQVPLGVFTPIGRGIYGRNFRWRITPNQDYEKEYNSKFFNFEILDVENGVTVTQNNTATIVTDPSIKNANFINDVIEDMDDNGVVADIHIFEENVEFLYNQYVEFCNELLKADPSLADVTIPSIHEFDPFFGKELKKVPNKEPGSLPFIKFTIPKTADVDDTSETYVAEDYTSMNTITVDNVSGNYFENGSDGSFADPDPVKRQDAINRQYEKAFLGDIDKLILSARRVPVTALYDANYDMKTKIALARLALHRLDSPLYLDTGFVEALTVIDIKQIAQDFEPIQELALNFPNLASGKPDDQQPGQNFVCSLNTHDYKIVEPSTGKRIRTTITYYLALTDSTYRRADNEKPIPRTGDNAVLTGHIKNSLSPAVDESEYEIKQALKDARINYFEATGINKFERATEMTFIKAPNENTSISDLGVENNVIHLLEMKRIAENEFRANRNNITTPSRRQDFRTIFRAKYEYLKGVWFDNFDVKYTANKFESKRNITHAYIAVTFFPRSEVTLIEIDVNEKSYLEDVEE